MNPECIAPFVFVDDISNGLENVQISFINKINFDTLPKDVSYIPNNILTSDALIEDFESVPMPCQCTDTCDASCPCGIGSNIAYQNGILSEQYIEDTSKPIVECSHLCTCKNCPNRVVQNGIKVHLQVFMTEQKGFGVQTLEFIPKLTFVCEYAGELIDKSEAAKRLENRSVEEPNYIFVLHEHNSKESSICTIIDPTFNGNVGRYLNHSCCPNLIPVPVRANSMVPRICFFAKRDIMPYEELTYHYGSGMHQGSTDDIDIHENNQISRKKCYCNSEQCTGALPFDGNWLY